MEEYRVIALIAEGFEETEAIAVIDLLRRSDINVSLVSITNEKIIKSARGISVICDEIFDDINLDNYELVFLPGGMPGTRNLAESKEVISILKDFDKKNKLIAAICAAPMILGKLGLLNKKNAVCFPGFEKDLIGANVLFDNVIMDENIITSRGMGTAIDLGLFLVSKIRGEEFSKNLERTIVYNSRRES
jgi:4-methyl-5(b-hydroxyethyl)-thiazole monophosphate biosynthesis